MLKLYLADAPASDPDLSTALQALPRTTALAWCADPTAASLTVRLTAGPPTDYTLTVAPPPPAATRLAWLATLRGRVQDAVFARVLRLPGPYRTPDAIPMLARAGIRGLLDHLPDLPDGRWRHAAQGALRLGGELLHRELDPDEWVPQLVALVSRPLWSPPDRLVLQRVAWTALRMVPHDAVRSALAAYPELSDAAGAYAASTVAALPAVRRPHPDWLVPADDAVAAFLHGAASRGLGATP